MSINVWFNAKTSTYYIKHNNLTYRRQSYLAAKDLIESLIPVMVIEAQHEARA